MKKFKIDLIDIFATICVCLGLTILLIFLWMLSGQYTIHGNGAILTAETGQVGDFVGGIVGSIWSFAGILLYFKALKMQRLELHAQRREFQIERTTNIIYKQIELIEKKEQNLKLLIPSRNINSIGTNVIKDFWMWSGIILNNKENINDLTKQEREEYDILFLTMSNYLLPLNKEVNKTLDIIIKLLEGSKEEDSSQLYLLFYHNYDLKNIKLLLVQQKKIFEFRNQVILSTNPKSELLTLFNNEIETIEKTLENIKTIENACA